MPKLDIPHFHTPESTTVDQSYEQFMLQEFGGLKHAPDLFPAENYRKFLDFWNGGKMEVAVSVKATGGLVQHGISISGVEVYTIEIFANCSFCYIYKNLLS